MERICPYCMQKLGKGGPCPGCGSDPVDYRPGSHHIPPGSRLNDRYVVGRVLGEGGFGITYLGLDTNLERRVAIKEYFPTCLVSRENSLSLSVTCYTQNNQQVYEKGRAQFLKEARTMARLEEIPEIVHVMDHFQTNNTAYIVMEFLEGETLKERTARLGTIPAGELLEMLRPVMRGMETMHQAGILHRDISPDNLMVLPSGRVKLMDFGCAKEIQGQPTQTVTLKHGFAPREQYTGRDQGPWTDVYALCATLDYCLTGKVPPRAVERRDGEQDPLLPPTQLGADLTPQQEQALCKGLAVQASSRWQSIAQLYAALYGVTLEGVPWTPAEEEKKDGQTEFVGWWQKEDTDHATPQPEKKRRPGGGLPRGAKGTIAAAMCIAVVLVAAIPLLSGRDRDLLPTGEGGEEKPQTTQQVSEQSDASKKESEGDINQESAAAQVQVELPQAQLEPQQSEGEAREPEDKAEEPEPGPAQTSAGQSQSSKPAQSGQSTQTTQPAQTTQPEPAMPTQEELEAQAENYVTNGQYLKAGETCHQMYNLGYLTTGKLGERLCDLGSDAQLDDEYEMGAQLYQQAMEVGNSLAKRLLANCYQYGTGVPQNNETAFRMNLELAQANYSASVYYDVATAYTDGIGTTRDPEQAIYWWNRYLETDDPKDSTREKIQGIIANLEGEL